ncbi:alkaline phosphatase family protein [Paenibacillus harenae]|uniref:AlkP superfamily pyrophosphatase or phosphodiesterase n=1 Tax=Paenibacillus harenae TaxID=306543 RepID=A0ABT9U5Y5_PAEHA|nr:alkaline phosphatase family protein [Paenibacillus harenae]MDQ0113649.1 putative AlkP superfamily pyrophosphatase or phosphodiesterase [Paenibacillus harenae]
MRILKIRIGMIALLLLSLLVCSCSKPNPKETDLLHIASKARQQEKSGKAEHKKVILLVADSLLYQSIDRGLEQNSLPAIKSLIDHGQYYKNVVSSFPTMSVTIDTTLLTGAYPNEHGLPGLIWYSEDENRIVNYGTGPMEIIKQGIKEIADDTLVNLNGKHIKQTAKTIYEEIDKADKITTGSINGLIYRGPTAHKLSIPQWIKTPISLPDPIKVKGPDFLSFGVFTNPLADKVKLPVQITDRLGFTNEFALQTTEYLIRHQLLPDFLYVYLPDLDQKLHRRGPDDMDGVIKLDNQLQRLLQAFGSTEKAIQEVVIMVIGDSGMSDILPKDQDPIVDLTKLLKDYRIQKPGADITGDTEIVLAVNETMAYVYKLHTQQTLPNIAGKLMNDKRIDLIAWREGDWIRARQGGTGRSLSYRAGGRWKDEYGQSWTWEGDASVMGMGVDQKQSRLSYGQFPDGLQRLSGALHSHKGQFFVVTTKEGYELTGGSSPEHTGGAGHGAMNANVSLVPLIVAGTNHKPDKLRMVDMKDYILDLIRERQ